MVILSWTNSTVAVVDISGEIAGATPTSVQAPIAFGINSGGTRKGYPCQGTQSINRQAQ